MKRSRILKGRNILCMECGLVFDMTKKECLWYTKNGFKKPSLCKACRMDRRQANRQWEKRMKKYTLGKAV